VDALGSRVVIASLTVVLMSLVAGYAAGGRAAPARASTGLVSGIRLTALGLIIIGTQLHANPSYLGPAIMFVLIDMIVAILVGLALGRGARAVARGSGSAASRAGGGRPIPAGSG